MKKTIKDIETWLPSGILQKGETYWINRQVDNLEQDGSEWVADVYGSEDYTVEVDMEGATIASWFCDCPYDYGPICKHVAAVLFAIRDEWTEEVEEVKPVLKKITSKKPISKKKKEDPLTTIIEKLDEAELRRLMYYFAGRHNQVKSHLLSNYANLVEHVSKEHFKNLVGTFIKANTSGRYGFIEYRQASQLGHQLTDLLLKDNSKAPMASVYLAEEIIAQTAAAIQHADDSSGSMGGAIAEGFSTLETFAEEENDSSAEVVAYIFQMAKEASSQSIYQDWDWAGNFRSLAVTATRKKADADALMEAFDKNIEAKNDEKYSSKYDIEQMEKLKHQLIQDWYSKEEAAQYLNNRLQFSSFRKMALEKAFKRQEYDTVLQLANDGVALDTENKLPGLVNEWKRWLIKHAEATDNQSKLIELNENMFLQRGNMEYYRTLKTLMSPTLFKAAIEKYINHFRRRENSRWGPSFNHQISAIFVAESRWADLMKEIERSPSLDLLDHYFAQLNGLFSAKYVEFYDQTIRKEMDRVADRKAYKNCCKYLQKIAQLEGRERAEKIAADWKKQYPRRRAMMEELKKVGF